MLEGAKEGKQTTECSLRLQAAHRSRCPWTAPTGPSEQMQKQIAEKRSQGEAGVGGGVTHTPPGFAENRSPTDKGEARRVQTHSHRPGSRVCVWVCLCLCECMCLCVCM